RWTSGGVRAEVSAFVNSADDFIFTTPTNTTQNGLRVFRHLQSDARLTGGEASVEARVSEPLTVRASHDFVRGDDRTNGVPLPLMPPPRTIVGAELALGTHRGLEHLRFG